MDLRSDDSGRSEQRHAGNLIWLHDPSKPRLPKQRCPAINTGPGEQAEVIELGDRRSPLDPTPSPRWGALDGTTGLPLGVSQDPPSSQGRDSAGTPLYDQVRVRPSDQVLVVHPDHEVIERISQSMRRIGFEVLPAVTSLQALWTLTHESRKVQAVLVSELLCNTSAVEFIHFLARRFPGLRRVLLVAEDDECPANDVDPRIDDVVCQRPWDVCALFAERR